MSVRRTARRVLFGLVALVALLAAVAVGVVIAPRFLPHEQAEAESPEARPPRSATDAVGPGGFRVEVAGAVVRGPAGVASPGTAVDVEVERNEPTAPMSDFTEATAQSAPVEGVSVELGDGAVQPAEPITITFTDLERESDEGDLRTVVLASRSDGTQELADAVWSSDGEDLVVTTDHLSFFQPVTASLSDFGDWLNGEIAKGIGAATNPPPCWTDGTVLDDQWEFEETKAWRTEEPMAWPCAEETFGETLTVDLTNNTPEVWRLTTDTPDAEKIIPIDYSVVGAGLIAVANQVYAETGRDGATPLVPGGKAGFQVPDSSTSVPIDAELDVEMTSTSSAMSALQVLMPEKKVKAVFAALGQTQCVVDTAGSVPGADTESVGNVTSAVVGCLGSFLGGTAGALIGGVQEAVRSGTGFASAQTRVENGEDRYEVTLNQVGSDAALDDLVGTWTGPIDQPTSDRAYGVVLEIFETPEGRLVGSTRYPELDNCTGELDRPLLRPNGSVSLRETITSGSSCADGRFQLTLEGPNTVYYSWENIEATGTLTRTNPADSAPTPTGGTWPTERDDGSATLQAFIAADLPGDEHYQDWTACDDPVDQSWCIAGKDDRVFLFWVLDDIDMRGSVSVDVEDPAAALSDLGVNADSVSDMLGTG